MKADVLRFYLVAFMAGVNFTLAQETNRPGNLMWLQMEIDSSSFMQVAHIPVEILVLNGSYAISPSHLNLHLTASNAWQLHMNFESDSNNKYPFQLSVRANKGIWNTLWNYPSKISQGYPYAGNMSFNINYELLGTIPPDGRYRGIVTYTLHRHN